MVRSVWWWWTHLFGWWKREYLSEQIDPAYRCSLTPEKDQRSPERESGLDESIIPPFTTYSTARDDTASQHQYDRRRNRSRWRRADHRPHQFDPHSDARPIDIREGHVPRGVQVVVQRTRAVGQIKGSPPQTECLPQRSKPEMWVVVCLISCTFDWSVSRSPRWEENNSKGTVWELSDITGCFQRPRFHSIEHTMQRFDRKGIRWFDHRENLLAGICPWHLTEMPNATQLGRRYTNTLLFSAIISHR